MFSWWPNIIKHLKLKRSKLFCLIQPRNLNMKFLYLTLKLLRQNTWQFQASPPCMFMSGTVLCQQNIHFLFACLILGVKYSWLDAQPSDTIFCYLRSVHIYTHLHFWIYIQAIFKTQITENLLKKKIIKFCLPLSSRDLIGSIWRFSIKSFPLSKYQLLKPKPFKGKGHSQLAFTITFMTI